MSWNNDEWKLVNEGSEVKLNAKSQWILDFYYKHKFPPNAIEYRDEWYPLPNDDPLTDKEGTRLHKIWRKEYLSKVNDLLYRPGKSPLGALTEKSIYEVKINQLVPKLIKYCNENPDKADSLVQKIEKILQ